MTVLSRVLDPLTKLPHLARPANKKKDLPSRRQNRSEKSASRNKEGVEESESEREEEGAERRTRCVFCLDLNGAERKAVGVRRRASEEKKERGKQVGVSGLFFFFLEGRTVMKPEHSSQRLHVWRGGRSTQCVITYQRNHLHDTNYYNGTGGRGPGGGDGERGCIVSIR